jgi:quercetin dioxygenase-like cupin family protein
MEPGAIVAKHSHQNEQLGVVVEGSVTLTISDETRATEAGDTYVVPSNAVHRAVAGPNGATLVETFVPVRDDYRRAWEAAAAST